MRNNNNSNKFKGVFIYISIIALILIVFIAVLGNLRNKDEKKNYSEILIHFDNYEVAWYSLDLGSGKLSFLLKDQVDAVDSVNYKNDDNENYEKVEYAEFAKEQKQVYTVPNVGLFISDIEKYRKTYNRQNPNDLLVENFIKEADNTFVTTFLPYIVLIVIMIAFSFFIMRQAAGGGRMSNFGSVKTKDMHAGKKITFADVAGADEEKEELEEIVDFMRDPRKYREIGARIPKGVLLVGPPGTGKTLLAKAVAGEANTPFFSISGSDFVEMFVGVGASRVRDLFEKAKKHTPSVIFIDEIDAVGRHRGAGLGGGHDEREQTLNQLLVEMDGFNENENIIIIAATNRHDILDPALLRPGRFDRQIIVNYPDIKGREEILKVHTRNKKLALDINLSDIAKTTAGFTGADLENLVNEGALLAARKNKKAITNDDIKEATIKVVAGPEKKSKVITEKEKRLTAYHEAGHAITTYFCPSQDKVHTVSIIPRGMAGGFTLSLPEHDKSYHCKTEFEEKIIVFLGGRVAEKLILDDISTGASNDIERATQTARNMVTRYGFSDKLGPMLYGQENQEVFLGRSYSQGGRNYSESVAAEIDEEMRLIIAKGYEKAEKILRDNSEKLHIVANYLITHEKIEGDDFEKLMKGELEKIEDPEFREEAKEVIAPPTESDMNAPISKNPDLISEIENNNPLSDSLSDNPPSQD